VAGARRCSNFAALLFLALMAVCAQSNAAAGSDPEPGRILPLPAFTAEDRILILAPHEDDETLAAGGAIQEAIAAGAKIRIVYLTYGDHNEFAFIAYRKSVWVSPKVNRYMGETRRLEARVATAHLGLAEANLIFLGYPDHDTLNIWAHAWDGAPPAYSLLTNTNKVPYPDALSYGKPHKGESILEDIGNQIVDFKPTIVFVSHPADANPDHRAFYLFLEAALMDLDGRITPPKVYSYITHMGPWPSPHGYHPDLPLMIPQRLADAKDTWYSLDLTQKEVGLKYEAVGLYRTQMADRASYLAAFARTNELFTIPRPLMLPKYGETTPELLECELCHATGENPDYESESPDMNLTGVSYRDTGSAFSVDVTLGKKVDHEFGIVIYAFGYKKGAPFASMPKLRIVSALGEIRVENLQTTVNERLIAAQTSGRTSTFGIPWKELGDPDAVFVQVHGIAGKMPTEQTAWRLVIRGGK
jgi:LmbE family N-acetylglucosaminyl deacetylase